MPEDQIPTKECFRVLKKQAQGNAHPSVLCDFIQLLRTDICACFIFQICTAIRKANALRVETTLWVNFKSGI